MQFIKKHYEKVILSIVLAGLALAAAALPLQVSQVQSFLDETVSGVVHEKPKRFEPINLTTNQALLAKLDNPPPIKLSGIHNLFNPVPWKKTPDGQWIKEQTGKELGAGALQVLAVHPLHFEITFEGANPPAEKAKPGEKEKPILRFTVLNESEAGGGRKRPRYAKLGDQNELFRVLEARPEDNPKEVVLELNHEKITLSDTKPTFSQVVGYAADLKYPPRNTTLHVRRGEVIRLPDDPENYKIVAITTNAVVLSASSTKKPTSIEVNPSPPNSQ